MPRSSSPEPIRNRRTSRPGTSPIHGWRTCNDSRRAVPSRSTAATPERFRTKHYTAHRRLGRVLVTAALVSVSLALIFGLRFRGAELPRPSPQLFSAAGSWPACCLLFEPFGAARCPSIVVG